jgi:hypothetical protein
MRFAQVAAAALAVNTTLAADDPVKDKLDAAKATFQEKLEKLSSGVLETIAKREEAARKSGATKFVDQYKADRETFTQKGVVPSWHSPSAYDKSLKAARGELIAAYDTAIKAYAKDSAKDAIRESWTKERETLAAEQAETVAGAIRKGSVRKGFYQQGNKTKQECELEVTSVAGTSFKATYRLKDPAAVVNVEGIFSRSNIAWKMREIEKGHLTSRWLARAWCEETSWKRAELLPVLVAILNTAFRFHSRQRKESR